MFSNKIIRKRVLAVLEKKIEDTQKIHDAHCSELDAKCKQDKDDHLENLIGEIIGKWL